MSERPTGMPSMKMRFRKNDPTHNLLAAAQHWLEAHGGKAVVLSGGKIITMPGDLESKFYIAVRCTGRRPVKRAGEGA